MSHYSDDFDDFSTHIHSDEMIPEFYEDVEQFYYGGDTVSRAHELAYGDDDIFGEEEESDLVDGDWRDGEDWDDDWSDEDVSDDSNEADDDEW